jgi:transposase
LAKRRLPEGIDGLAGLHALIADHLAEDAEPAEVLIGIETDRGPWVQALIAAGYTVYAVNPLQVARYRQRHGTAGAKSDPGDAHTLAELVRLDRAHHRPVAGDSELAEHVKVLARTHQSLIWSRQRQTNTLRSMLREFYPGALQAAFEELAGRDALAVLAIAPSPETGRRLSLSKITATLRRAAATQPAGHCRQRPGGAARSATPCSSRGGRRLHCRGALPGRRHHRAGDPDPGAAGGGGGGFWPAPGR